MIDPGERITVGELWRVLSLDANFLSSPVESLVRVFLPALRLASSAPKNLRARSVLAGITYS